MLRLIAVVLVLLLASAGLLYYYDIGYGFFSVLLVGFTEKTAMRWGKKLLITLLIYPLLPDSVRRWIDEAAFTVKHAILRFFDRRVQDWEYAPWWMRLIMLMIGAMLAGLIAAILLILPVHVRKIPYAGEVLQKRIVPWLLHRSAIGQVEKKIPEAAKVLPIYVRRTLGHAYLWLWWKTAVPLFESRQSLSTAMERRLKQIESEKIERFNEAAEAKLAEFFHPEQRASP